MQGHESMASTTTTTTPKSASSSSSSTTIIQRRPYDEIGNEAAASAKIDNVVRVPPPKGFVYNPPANNIVQEERFESGAPLYRRVSPKFFTRRPINNNNNNNQEGPLVVKVYPDGRPVEDEQQNLVPQDEDLRQYLLAKVQLPVY